MLVSCSQVLPKAHAVICQQAEKSKFGECDVSIVARYEARTRWTLV